LSVNLYQAVKYSLNQLRESVVNMDDGTYADPAKIILKASVGEHVRHIIEMYFCMIEGYGSGTINYDKRKRNMDIEQNRDMAVSAIDQIMSQIEKPELNLILESHFGGQAMSHIPTTYEREVHYNLEHTIHHMAIIRIKIESEPNMAVDEDYGVAYSTVQHRKSLEQTEKSS
jgi:hypothetical protein